MVSSPCVNQMFSIVSVLLSIEGSAWWNYPGFELWRIVNLIVFVGAAVYLHRRFGHPVREALKSRRERIKNELQRARQERDLALKKLAEVELRLESLDAEVLAIRKQANAEAEAERERIKRATEVEISKLREQARREIEGAAKAAKRELRRFVAQQSVELAEGVIRSEIRPEDDTRLIRMNVEQLGRSSH